MSAGHGHGPAHHDEGSKKIGLLIAILALVLALSETLGKGAQTQALSLNIEASNLFNFFQAKNMRQTAYAIAADELELAWTNDAQLSAEAKTALRRKVDDYRKTVTRYESEPETGEGKKELMAKAKDAEKKRDHALRQDPYFDYAEALLQIAIVLISVAIVAEQIWLSYIGASVGAIGALLMINGFLLFVRVPFLG